MSLTTAGVRLLAFDFLLTAACRVIYELINAFVWTPNPFAEIPSAWYSMTTDWPTTWGTAIADLVVGVTLWITARRVARLCLPATPDAHACPACGYDLAGSTGASCPECGRGGHRPPLVPESSTP